MARTATPGRRRPIPATLIVAALVLLAFAAVACSTSDEGDQPGPTVVRPPTSGEPRSLRLGLSSTPPERTGMAYVGAFATAAQYADVVAIQRSPPWGDFMPGGTVSETTAETTRLETALLQQYHDLGLYYAIDPTDAVVQRNRIADLPSSVDPAVGFLDPDLRNAFIAYVAYVAKNYHPDYLAIGVEINMLYERSRAQFEAFATLYGEAYAIAKAASPGTKVFPTIQLEDLEGRFGIIHPPHWEVLDYFRGRMDALAISTYPFLGELRSAADIPRDYYTSLTGRFSGEVLIAEAGYASAPVEGAVNVGTDEDQQAYLARLLEDAEASGFTLVNWAAALDPAFAREGAAAVLRDIGLRHADGANKLAWTTWEEWARRPLN